jgi:hypothetical protein
MMNEFTSVARPDHTAEIYFDAHLKALERFATSDPPAMAAGFVEMRIRRTSANR